jgi:hypothetical protein
LFRLADAIEAAAEEIAAVETRESCAGGTHAGVDVVDPSRGDPRPGRAGGGVDTVETLARAWGTAATIDVEVQFGKGCR